MFLDLWKLGITGDVVRFMNASAVPEVPEHILDKLTVSVTYKGTIVIASPFDASAIELYHRPHHHDPQLSHLVIRHGDAHSNVPVTSLTFKGIVKSLLVTVAKQLGIANYSYLSGAQAIQFHNTESILLKTFTVHQTSESTFTVFKHGHPIARGVYCKGNTGEVRSINPATSDGTTCRFIQYASKLIADRAKSNYVAPTSANDVVDGLFVLSRLGHTIDHSLATLDGFTLPMPSHIVTNEGDRPCYYFKDSDLSSHKDGWVLVQAWYNNSYLAAYKQGTCLLVPVESVPRGFRPNNMFMLRSYMEIMTCL